MLIIEINSEIGDIIRTPAMLGRQYILELIFIFVHQ
jgi:hypothetical protein